jgi:hypothetical protein
VQVDRRHPFASRRRLGIALFLGLLVALLNANALNAFFLGDDFDILWKTKDQHDLSQALRMTFVGNWGPMSYVQFYLNYRLGGLDPFVYHLTNLLWLWLAVVALFGFVRTAWPEEPLAAWAAALLFVTHPANDQAVSYICARSHSIGAALAVAALCLYARFRLRGAARAARALLLSGALLAGFLAGLSKETALTLPAWIAAFEWLFAGGDRGSRGRAMRHAVAAAVLFALAASAVFGARRLVVGGEPPRLEEAAVEAGDLAQAVVWELPIYALAGGLPLPFSWFDLAQLVRLQVLGWIVLGGAIAAGAACLGVAVLRGSARLPRAAALYVLGLTIASVSLLPILYAELVFQRRYLFIVNVGIVLMAVAALQPLHARFPRAVRGLVALLVLAGGAGTIQRNELHRGAGRVARNLIETVFQAPVEELPGPGRTEARSVVLVTLPRYYGGDRVSGVILLHRTDLYSALRLFGIGEPWIAYPLLCRHAEDYSARAELVSDSVLDLAVSFRSRRAYGAARARDLRYDQRRDAAAAELVSADPERRVLRYRVTLADGFWEEHGELFLYGDERFTRLHR